MTGEAVSDTAQLKRTNLGHQMQQPSFIQIRFDICPSSSPEEGIRFKECVFTFWVKSKEILFSERLVLFFKYSVVVKLCFLLHSALLFHPLLQFVHVCVPLVK